MGSASKASRKFIVLRSIRLLAADLESLPPPIPGCWNLDHDHSLPSWSCWGGL